MTKFKIVNGIPSPLYQSQIEVSVDKDSDLLIITDIFPNRYAVGIPLVNTTGVAITVKVTVPLRYFENNSLIVGIVDSNKEFAASFIDGVNAQLIDASIIDISQ